MKHRFIVLICLTLFVLSCKERKGNTPNTALISTEFGDIKILLFDDTPLHRDNFIKLVNDGFYDNAIFHRVIDGFMIQGGDPKGKDAPIDLPLGGGGPGYTIPAEIIYPKHYHKRGALAAARQADRFNPKRESSGSQFYIVQGHPFDTIQLKQIAVKRNDVARNKVFNRIIPQYRDSFDYLMHSQMPEQVQKLQTKVMAEIDSIFLSENGIFTFTTEQIETYTSIGGSPFLDNQYTVFGEVIEGMNVVDSIAKVKKNSLDRPLRNIEFSIKMISK